MAASIFRVLPCSTILATDEAPHKDDESSDASVRPGDPADVIGVDGPLVRVDIWVGVDPGAGRRLSKLLTGNYAAGGGRPFRLSPAVAEIGACSRLWSAPLPRCPRRPPSCGMKPSPASTARTAADADQQTVIKESDGENRRPLRSLRILTALDYRSSATSLAIDMSTCRLCGGSSTRVVEYDLGKLGGFWAQADCETTVEIRKCTRFGSLFTARIPRRDLLIGQYLIDLGEFYTDPFRKPDARAVRCVGQVLPHLHAGQSILDVGGGNGAFAFQAAGKGLRAMLQEHGKVPARALLSAGVTVVNSLEEVPSGTADAVSLWDVYEHVWPHDEFLQPIKRVLKPKGLLFVEIPSPSNLVPLFIAMSRFLSSPKSERALAQICNFTHLQLMTPDELRHSLEAQGFTIQHLTGFSELSYRGVAYAERLIGWKAGAKVVGALFDNAYFRRMLLGKNKTFAVAQIA